MSSLHRSLGPSCGSQPFSVRSPRSVPGKLGHAALWFFINGRRPRTRRSRARAQVAQPSSGRAAYRRLPASFRASSRPSAGRHGVAAVRRSAPFCFRRLPYTIEKKKGLPEHYREEPGGRHGHDHVSKIGAAARTKGPLFSGCRQPARLLNRCAPRRRQWNNPFIMSYFLLLGCRTLPVWCATPLIGAKASRFRV